MIRHIGLTLLLLVSLPCNFATAQEKKLEPLVVAYSSITGNRAPLWIAKDLGLFEKYGLDVKLVNIAAGSVSLAALMTGAVQLTTDSSSGIVSAAARGAPLAIVSTNGALPYQLVGMDAGVDGTPAFFINGRMISGAQPFEVFKRIIDEELELKTSR